MAVDNLKLEKELTKLVKQRAAALASSTKQLRDQLQLQIGIKEAMTSGDIDQVIDKMKTFSETSEEALKKTADAANKQKDVYDKAAEAYVNAEGGLQGLIKGAKAYIKENKNLALGLASVGSSLKGTFSFGKAILTRVWGLTTSIVGGMFSVGRSILAIPFKIIGGLFDMAGSGGGGTELAQAYEKVREEFGSLKDGIGSLVIQTSKNLQPALMGTGLSAMRVFGNVAERIAAMQKLFSDLGADAVAFADELAGAGAGKIAVFQKGLGLSADGLKSFALEAKTTGKTLEQQLSEVNNLAQQMGPAFAGSAKMMARQMGEIKKMPQFITHTNKQLAESVAYSSQLGIEAGKLAGVLDRFDSFDTAAESADKLAQAFGANIDVMKMMQAETETERIDMLRQSMAAAGQDASNMTRQQLKLLAAQTNLDEETAKAAFSLENQGKSLEEIKKASKDAEKKPLSQAEAMSKLGDSIERLVKSGGDMGKGFFGPLLKGFETALKMSAPFRNLMLTLKKFQWTLRRTGRGLANLFLDNGLGKFLGAFTKTFKKIKSIIDDFNTTIAKGGDAGKAFENLRNRLTDFATNFFKTDMWKTMKESVVEMLTKFSKFIAKSVLPQMVKSIADLLEGIISFIENPTGITTPTTALGKIFAPLVNYFKSPEGQQTVQRIIEGVKNLFSKLMEKIKPVLTKLAATFAKLMVARFAAGATFNIAGATISNLIAGKIFGKKQIASALSAAQSQQLQSVASSVTQGNKKIDNLIKSLAAGRGAPGSGAAAGSSASRLVNFLGTAGKTAGKMLTYVAVGAAVVFALGAAMMLIMKGWQGILGALSINLGDIAKVGMLMSSLALMMVPVGLVALGLAGLGALMMASAGTGALALLAGAGIIIGVGAVMPAIAKFFEIVIKASHVTPSTILKVEAIMLPIADIITAIGKVALVLAAVGTIAVFNPLGFIAGFFAMRKVTKASVELIDELLISVSLMSEANVDKAVKVVKMLSPLSDMLKAFASLMEAVRPSIFKFTNIVDDNMTKRIGAVTKLAKTFLKESASLISGIVDQVKALDADSKDLEKAAALAQVLGAIAPLLKAITPSDALMDASSKWYKKGTVKGGMRVLAKTVKTQLDNIIIFIDDVVLLILPNLLSALSGYNKEDIEKVSALGSLFDMIRNLLSSMTPSDSLVKAQATWAGSGTNMIVSSAGAIKIQLDGIKDSLMPAILMFVDKILPKLKGITSGQIEAIKVLGSFMEIVTSLLDVMTPSPEMIKANDNFFQFGDAWDKIAKGFPKFLDKMKEPLQQLITKMADIFLIVNKKFVGITINQEAFAGFESITGLMDNLAFSAKNTMAAATIIPEYLDTVDLTLQKLGSVDISAQAVDDIKKVVMQINAINDEFSDIPLKGGGLDIALTNFAKAAQQNVKHFTLNVKRSAFHIHMNVKMDGEALATSLSDGSIKTKDGSKQLYAFTGAQAAQIPNVLKPER